MQNCRSVLFFDYCGIRDKDVFLAELAEEMSPASRLVVVDEVKRKDPVNALPFEVLKAPKGIFRAKRSFGLDLLSKPRRALRADPLASLSEHLTGIRREKNSSYPLKQAHMSLALAYKFTSECLKLYKPDLVIVWNQFHPLSQTVQAAARDCSVRVAFAEYGLLPGTVNFDFAGQMGESDIVQHSDAFAALPIDTIEIERARSTLDALRKSGANRRQQKPLETLGDDLLKQAMGRPIVFFAGHNDHASGTIPYDDHARRYHSPIFATSRDTAHHLAKLARENDWFLIYKPHPFARRSQGMTNAANVTVLSEDADIAGCINLAQCVVTTVSQTSYVALLHGKPLVMLGYNQLKGSGCHYQAETYEEIACKIHEALSCGITEQQQDAWVFHIARVLKYYLHAFPGNAPSLQSAQSIAALAGVINRAMDDPQSCLNFRNSV